ncbi:hypothetical protein [Candidatus Methanomassiliicoccus intestinalis]|uniref:hypothetical protein n=1 Tax=Candidatus Methanomassiliicoccus intestinalis TaxID=1406512 RepID=UPI0037DC62B7
MEKKTTMLVAIVAVIVILLAAVGALYATGNLGGGGEMKTTQFPSSTATTNYQL